MLNILIPIIDLQRKALFHLRENRAQITKWDSDCVRGVKVFSCAVYSELFIHTFPIHPSTTKQPPAAKASDVRMSIWSRICIYMYMFAKKREIYSENVNMMKLTSDYRENLHKYRNFSNVTGIAS